MASWFRIIGYLIYKDKMISKNMKKTLTLGLLCCMFCLTGYGQTILGISGQVGVPINDFRDNTDAVGGGIRGNLLFAVAPKIPVYFGLDLGYMIYGSSRQDINENLEVRAGNAVVGNIPINLSVKTNNNLLNGYALLRFKAPLPIVQPYIDGAVGFNYLYTRTKVTDETRDRLFSDPDGSRVISAQTQSNSFVFSYGGGGGVMIKLASNLKLDLRVLYLLGGEAEYFDSEQTQNWTVTFTGSGTFNPQDTSAEDIEISNDDAIPKQSATDLISVNLGIAFTF